MTAEAEKTTESGTNTESQTYIGVDVGTSGVRALCIRADGSVCHRSDIRFSQMSGERRDPRVWVQAVSQVLTDMLSVVDASSIAAIAIDGTSGTMLGTDDDGTPLTQAKMYSDTCDEPALLEQISRVAPPTSAAHGASSGLAKAIQLNRTPCVTRIAHEADWLASLLSGVAGLSDENNALKTGYDPVSSAWPDWIGQTELGANLSSNSLPNLLPRVLPAGEPIGPAVGTLAKTLGLSESTLVVAGTTDGCASFLATGASAPGEGVTVLGSTLTLKLLSDVPIFAPEYGIYSHRIGDVWLAGGASNTGGAVLAHFFNTAQLQKLSSDINVTQNPDLNYYPLLKYGERFPVNNSNHPPKLTPRPDSDALFLHGLLQGMTDIEKLGYQRLAELGASALKSLRTVGGGSVNTTWETLRQQTLGVPMMQSLSGEAAMGAALLAQRGAAKARGSSQ